MNGLHVFNHHTFGELEAILIDGKPYFPATKCAEMLGYEKPHNAIERHCRYSLKRGVGVQTGVKADGSPAMQTVEMNFISEGDLIRLITHSKLPAAMAFESWVMDTVIPSVIHHGAYATDDLLNNPDLLIEVAKKLKEERDLRIQEEQQRKLLEIKLDTSSEWYTIKRFAQEHGMNWRNVGDLSGRGQGWKKLKALSAEHGYDIQRSFDANYGSVNAYHRDMFELL